MRTGQMKLVSPVPAPMKLSEKTATLVRITAGPKIVVDRTYGNFTIQPCKPGQRFTTQKIHSARCIAGSKDSRREWEVKAEEVAEDLAMECNTNIWGIGSTVTGELIETTDGQEDLVSVRGFNGVFVSDFDEPSEEELQLAESLLAASDAILVTAGNETHDQLHNPLHIHAGFKRAAQRLGVEADWLYTIVNKNGLPDCQFCGSKMKTMSATVCATCGREQKRQLAPPQAKGNSKNNAAA